jgi:hypothetical protein
MQSTALRTLTFSFLIVLGASGCQRHLYSPPTQISVADGPAPIGKSNTQVSGQYLMGGAIFGPDIEGGSLRVRHGVTDRQDVSLTATAILIHEYGYDADTNRSLETYHPVFAGRLGTKWSPNTLQGHFALSAGLGMGGSKGGYYVSPDAGLLVGWTNRIVTPFYALSGFVSQPIAPKMVDLAEAGEAADLQRARFTYGFQQAVGLRRDFQLNTGNSWSLMTAFTQSSLYDLSDEDGIGVLGLSFEAGYQF